MAEPEEAVDRGEPPDPNTLKSSGDSGAGVLITIIFLVVAYLVSKLLRSFHDPARLTNPSNNGKKVIHNHHYWHFSDLILHPIHCNVCHSLLLTTKGQFCSNCGIGSCLNVECVKKANSTHFCKEVFTSYTKEEAGGRFRHHWIAGNLPLNSECEVCEESCGDGTGIVDLRCCWCQRTVHYKCQQQLSELCDFGDFARFIVPPFCVKVEVKESGRSGLMGKKHAQVSISDISELTSENWSPLVVIGNRKSGNNDGAAILAAFRSLLNPGQISDLSEVSVEASLEWVKKLGKNVITVVAGGDGTIGWILNTMEKLDVSSPLFLLPLGTGNDLARSLGYGSGVDASCSVPSVMKDVSKMQEVKLDRWKVVVNPQRHFGIKLPIQTIFMQNYLSIGVDALVTYNFHRARESPFYVMSSRLINKMIYFSYGTKDVLERECKNLDAILEIRLDDEQIKLPNIESVVILNIPCWGAGVRPWELGAGHRDFDEPSISDKKLEIFCIYSSFHIAQMQVGLSEPHRLGQANKVEIILRGSAPMQTDGEPWEQHPAEITITHHNQVSIMRKTS